MWGGGITTASESVTVINSTFYNNMATERGGGIGILSNLFNLWNSILIDNTAIIAGNAIYLTGVSLITDIEATIDHNLIGGGVADLGAGLYDTDNNTFNDVPFADATNVTLTNTIEESDAAAVFASLDTNEADYLRLRAGSPTVDAGDNAYLNNGTPENTEDDIMTDAAGEPRIQGGTVDLGAYESDPSTSAAPTISISTTDTTIEANDTSAISVAFTVGGNATGWESTVTGNFITLDTAMNNDQTGEVTITATPSANPGAKRVAKIVISTTGGGTAVSDTLTITQKAGKKETDLGISLDESLTLYPNPTDGLFFIEGLSGALEVHIHDLLGRQVATYSLSAGGGEKVDVSVLSSGMYVVTLKESGGELLTRILIKHRTLFLLQGEV